MAASLKLTPSTRGALQLGVQVTLAVILFALLELLATRHNVRFDLTEAQSFVLSDQARQIASAVAEPVRITVFYNSQESGQRRDLTDLLEQFSTTSHHISFRLVDLDRSPGLAKKYGISSYNSGVVETDGRLTELKTVDESEIASALLKLTRARTRTLCFVTGHGERNPEDADDRQGYSEVAKALEREHFAIRTLSTIPVEGVPADCTVTVLAGPSHDLLPGEADALTAHVRRGGKVFLLIDPDAPPSVIDLARRFGVEPGNDLIVDDRNRFFGADSFMPRVPIFDQQTFKRSLDTAAVLSLARTVRPAEQPPPGTRVLLLALTSPDSWARTDGGKTPDENVRFRQGTDHPGPLPVAVLAAVRPAGTDGVDAGGSGEASDGGGRLVVMGDSDFATNFYLNLLGNKDLFMNTVAVLAEDPELVAVRRKGRPRGSISPIFLTAEQGRAIFWTAVVLMPALSVLTGAAVGWVRRRQRGGR